MNTNTSETTYSNGLGWHMATIATAVRIRSIFLISKQPGPANFYRYFYYLCRELYTLSSCCYILITTVEPLFIQGYYIRTKSAKGSTDFKTLQSTSANTLQPHCIANAPSCHGSIIYMHYLLDLHLPFLDSAIRLVCKRSSLMLKSLGGGVIVPLAPVLCTALYVR